MKNKDLDTQLNLISFISLLSGLTCMLLVTAVWIQVGSLNVKQAIGGQSGNNTAKEPALWATMLEKGSVLFYLEDAPKLKLTSNKTVIKGDNGQLDKKEILNYLTLLKKELPQMNTALMKPSAESVYEDMIVLMDQIKSVGLLNLGVTPL